MLGRLRALEMPACRRVTAQTLLWGPGASEGAPQQAARALTAARG